MVPVAQVINLKQHSPLPPVTEVYVLWVDAYVIRLTRQLDAVLIDGPADSTAIVCQGSGALRALSNCVTNHEAQLLQREVSRCCALL